MTKKDFKLYRHKEFGTLSTTDNILNYYPLDTFETISSEDIYFCDIKVADTLIDKSYDCFTYSALENIQELLLGKSITSTIPNGKNTTVGIVYDAQIKEIHSTDSPVLGCELIANVAILKRYDTLVEKLKSGKISKANFECSVSERRCSVCNKSLECSFCRHIKGKYYDGQLCFHYLEKVDNVFEVSLIDNESQDVDVPVEPLEVPSPFTIAKIKKVVMVCETNQGNNINIIYKDIDSIFGINTEFKSEETTISFKARKISFLTPETENTLQESISQEEPKEKEDTNISIEVSKEKFELALLRFMNSCSYAGRIEQKYANQLDETKIIEAYNEVNTQFFRIMKLMGYTNNN